MTEDELIWLDIAGTQAAIAAGQTTTAEVVDRQLARIERLDPDLKAFAQIYAARARQQAEAQDDALRRGDSIGPLHGVTVALKDLCDVEGEPTKAGTTALGDKPAREDAEVVRRLVEAGAILLGKVKMTEGALVEHHPSVVPPVNPWHAERWTGISSSGSGVSVAAGLCHFALGTDTGGSIRYPSSACGLSGLKPTHGRVSLRGVYPLAASLDHIGPMARSVEDVARAFRVLCGRDPRDGWSLASEPEPTDDPDVSVAEGAVIGYDAKFAEEGVSPFVVDAIHAAMDSLRARGAKIVEVEIPDPNPVLGAWVAIGSSELANAHAATYPSKKSEYGPGLAAMIEAGRAVSGRDVSHAWMERIAFSRRLGGLFERKGASGLDAIVAPVIPGRFPHTTNLGDPSTVPNGSAAMRFTSPFNLSGSPSLTLCGGFDDEDQAPIGFQLVGAHESEEKLLSLGAAYQAETDFHTQHPTC